MMDQSQKAQVKESAGVSDTVSFNNRQSTNAIDIAKFQNLEALDEFMASRQEVGSLTALEECEKKLERLENRLNAIINNLYD